LSTGSNGTCNFDVAFHFSIRTERIVARRVLCSVYRYLRDLGGMKVQPLEVRVQILLPISAPKLDESNLLTFPIDTGRKPIEPSDLNSRESCRRGWLSSCCGRTR